MGGTIAGVRRVAVIGAGTIGASWAANFLARGLAVTASDPAPEGEAFLRRYVAEAWPVLSRLGLAPDASPDRLTFTRDPLEAVIDADFVQESGPEREDAKIELFRRLDAVLGGEVVIASSSSGLLISRLQAGCRYPGRCVIGHPFNPPHLIPLVEVVGGAATSPDVIARAMAFYAALGKKPIHIRKEVAGHLANRLQAALWREAVHLVAEGVAEVADVDAARSLDRRSRRRTRSRPPQGAGGGARQGYGEGVGVGEKGAGSGPDPSTFRRTCRRSMSATYFFPSIRQPFPAFRPRCPALTFCLSSAGGRKRSP